MKFDKICIIGAGYVGITAGAIFADKGYEVIFRDINEKKNKDINNGISPIKEVEVVEIFERNLPRISSISDINKALSDVNIAFVCVGTPSKENGEVNLDFIYNVASEVSKILQSKKDYFLLVLRSTIPPGTSRKVIDIIKEKSGKVCGKDFGVCMNPEFLREGRSVEDFYNPSFTIIGQSDEVAGKNLEEFYLKFGLNKNIFYKINLEEAEIFKYLNNVFHALKIGFTNEVLRVTDEYSLDSHKIMDMFVKDTQLNISPYYMRPGAPFGGSCLPKDTNALLNTIKNSSSTPIIENILKSNKDHIEFTVDKIMKLNGKRVLFSSLVFKKNTDDYRYSPYIDIMKELQSKGIFCNFIDKHFENELIGANRDYIESLEITDFFTKDPNLSEYDIIIICSESLINIGDLLNFKGKIFDLNGIIKDSKLSKLDNYYIL